MAEETPELVWTITRAIDFGGWYGLECVDPSGEFYEGQPFGYALYPDDPFGNAPALNQMLTEMVEEEKIVIEAPPTAEQHGEVNDTTGNG